MKHELFHGNWAQFLWRGFHELISIFAMSSVFGYSVFLFAILVVCKLFSPNVTLMTRMDFADVWNYTGTNGILEKILEVNRKRHYLNSI
jgi:hypothetical protein